MPTNQDELVPITTLLTPSERPKVDAAGEGYYRSLHRENIEQLIQDIKSTRIQAVLISVSCTNGQATRMASLVREFPRVPAVALLSDFETRTPQTVLALGQSGIRRLVDVRSAAGWRELRGALMADAVDSGQRNLLTQLALDLAEAPADCRHFFELLFTCPPRIGNIRQMSRLLTVLPSTLMSRFFRAGVPAPKRYLAMARLVRAARLFENSGFSVANVANHLEYSSPQSFGRHVRTVLSLTAGEFRRDYDGAGMFARFRAELIVPYRQALCSLHPLCSPPGWARAKVMKTISARS